MEISWVCAQGNMSGLDAGPEAEGDCLLAGPLPRVWLSEVLRTRALLAQAPTTPLGRVRVPKPCLPPVCSGTLADSRPPPFCWAHSKCTRNDYSRRYWLQIVPWGCTLVPANSGLLAFPPL